MAKSRKRRYARRGKARRTSSRRRSSSRRRAKKVSQCCPVITVKCKARAGKSKICTVRVGGHRARKMPSSSAGVFIGKIVRAQKKRRCVPLVKGSAS